MYLLNCLLLYMVYLSEPFIEWGSVQHLELSGSELWCTRLVCNLPTTQDHLDLLKCFHLACLYNMSNVIVSCVNLLMFRFSIYLDIVEKIESSFRTCRSAVCFDIVYHTLQVVVTQMNGVNHPSESIHVLHVGRMRIKLRKGKTTVAKEYYSTSMQV